MITVYSTIHEYLLYWNSLPFFTERMHADRAKFIKKIYAPCIGNIRLDEFCEEHIRKLQQYMEEKLRISESTYFIALRIFRQAMKYAEEHLLINDSFCDTLYIPRAENAIIKIYTSEEINAIFTALEYGDPLCNCYKLLYYTALTISEVRAIRRTDIDLQNRLLHIRQRLYGGKKNNYHLEVLDDSYQTRDIYLTDKTIAVLTDELARNEERRKKKYWKDNGQDLLFTLKNGDPLLAPDLKKTKQLIKCVTGISDFSTLSLRYTAVDAALKAGTSEKEIQDLLGFRYLSYVYRLKEKFIQGEQTKWK